MVSDNDASINLGLTLKLADLKIQLKEARALMKKYLKSPELKNSTGSQIAMKQLMNVEQAIQSTKKQMRELIVGQKTVSKGMKGFNSQFLSAGLGVMFFGMAVKNLTQNIMKSAFTTFNEIMHSTEGTVTSFDRLGGELTYIKFLIGEALEPFAEALVPIVAWMGEWLANNEWVAAALIALFAAGSFLFVGGQLALGLNGIIEAVGLIKKGFKALPGIWEKIKNFDVNAMKDKFDTWGKALKTGIVDNMKWIKDNPIKTLFAVGVLTAIIYTAFALYKISEAMGGLPELAKSVGRGLTVVFGMVASHIGAAFGKVFEWIIDVVNAIIGFMNKVFKTDWGKFDKTGLSFKEMQEIQMTNWVTLAETWFGKPEIGYQDNLSLKDYITGNFGENIVLEVNVNLDGDKVADSVTTKINDSIATRS